MRVAIAGGHGKIGLRTTRLLSHAGDEVRSLIRKPEDAGEVRAAGGDPVVCDLEAATAEQLATAVGPIDAVVFAAGAGPGSGPERKWTTDYGGAAKLIAAARANRIDRYVMVSSMGADPNAAGDDQFAVYLQAKGKADAELEASGLAYTIVKPGRLTDDRGTGHVQLGDRVERAEISRDDVAAVIVAVLGARETVGRSFGVVAGDVPIEQAVRAI